MGSLGNGAMSVSPSPPPNAAQARDDWLDALLLQDAQDAAYVQDDGFTGAVMQRLPAPAVLPAWRTPIVALLWLVAGVLLAAMLPHVVQDAAREVVRVVAATPVSLSMLALLVVALGAATWTATAVALRRD